MDSLKFQEASQLCFQVSIHVLSVDTVQELAGTTVVPWYPWEKVLRLDTYTHQKPQTHQFLIQDFVAFCMETVCVLLCYFS